MDECRENRDGQGIGAAVVGGLPDLGRRAVRIAGLLAEPSGGAEYACESRPEGVGAAAPVGRRGGDHQSGVLGQERFGIEAVTAHDARAEVVNHDVAGCYQPPHVGQAPGVGQVDPG